MPTVVHFVITADNLERATEFYENLFDWKIESPPGMNDYYSIDTKDLNGQSGVGGGLAKRDVPGERITSYFGVDSIDEYLVKVKKLGGKIIQPKMPVLGWGYLAMCMDTEDNMFGLWQDDTDTA